ncbi:class I tRNA ligase family protein [Burkholderia gladioli]|uniref:class I tRNA ligase family protein n=1 Tax=Burkholderia gladioli TaxID=28095 RepID=UPI00264EAE3A|nr:class I tRNA ligase family protein [Burkholderia gladioli]MDN7750437.1 class I tRNA ligase family protein [Burkholderia gladioli]
MTYRYITTPIYYVNDRPHLGHAYASVHADIMARYLRASGHQTMLLTGADEHGEKIAKAAMLANEAPCAFADRHAQTFVEAWRRLSVEPDKFVRTTTPEHAKVVAECLSRLFEAGEIYLSDYEGLYSVGQERFVTEKELVNGKLPEDKEPPVLRREPNYFFRMEMHRDWIRQLLLDSPDLIQPVQYRNEILRLLEEPIGDLSISRPVNRLDWGIPIPWDAGHVTYVWFDALLSYVSPLGYPDQPAFRNYWPSVRHVIGKDILRTHTLFWLSMTHALGIAPYQCLHVSGHLLGSDGRKMSKSLGNGVDPLEAADTYGVDALRYTLIREVSFGFDGIISNAVIEQRLNRDLADDLGNLVARTLAMANKYRNGVVPAPKIYGASEDVIIARASELPSIVLELVDEMKLGRAAEQVMDFVKHLNGYVASSAPWALAKDPDASDKLNTVLYTLLEAIYSLSNLLHPVMPGKMHELKILLGVSGKPCWNLPWGNGVKPGGHVKEGILFPKRPGRDSA